MKKLFFIFFLFLVSANLFGLSQEKVLTYTTATLSFDQNVIVSNKDNTLIENQIIWAKLSLKHKKNWHSYWQNPGDSGLPTKIKWEASTPLTAGDTLWDYPEIFFLGPIVNYGYNDQASLLVPLKIKQSEKQDSVLIKASAEWLVCKEECIPENTEFEFVFPVQYINSPSLSFNKINRLKETLLSTQQLNTTFTVVDNIFSLSIPKHIVSDDVVSIYFFPEQHPVIKYKEEQRFSVSDEKVILNTDGIDTNLKRITGFLQIKTANETRYFRVSADNDINVTTSSFTFLTFMAFAFLGGLILNIMPCVFPVLSLKVLAMVKHAKQNQSKIKQESLAYTAGVLVSFYVLVCTLLLLKGLGQQIGWGFQLQSPMFIYFMIALMMLVGLNLNGFFELPTWLNAVPGKLSNVHNKTTTQSNNWGSFFTGVLAVIIATPCTAPFMASAIGFAFTQSFLVNILIFTALGIGFSSPYILVSFYPAAISFLPKPGAWMVKAKHILAVPMYITVLWLIAVFYFQLNVIGVVIALCLVLALIIYCLTGIFESKKIQTAYRLLTVLLILGLSLLVYNLELKSKPLTTAASFEKIESSLANNQAVFVDVTAAWCLSCKVNEELILNTEEIQGLFKENNVNYIVLDWTNEDENITNYLSSFERQGVPLYVFYNTEGEVSILPQILTKKIIKDYILK